MHKADQPPLAALAVSIDEPYAGVHKLREKGTKDFLL